MRLHIGPLPTRMTTFPERWDCEVCRENGASIIGIQVYGCVTEECDVKVITPDIHVKFSVCRTPVANCRNSCCTPSNVLGVA